MPAQRVDLGAPNRSSSTNVRWNNLSALVRPGLVSGGGAAYLRYLDITDFGTNLIQYQLQFASTATGTPGATGPDLTTTWEGHAEAVTLVAGSASVTIPGPNNSVNTIRDATEPYTWYTSGTATRPAGLTAFFNAAGSGATLTLDDGVEDVAGSQVHDIAVALRDLGLVNYSGTDGSVENNERAHSIATALRDLGLVNYSGTVSDGVSDTDRVNSIGTALSDLGLITFAQLCSITGADEVYDIYEGQTAVIMPVLANLPGVITWSMTGAPTRGASIDTTTGVVTVVASALNARTGTNPYTITLTATSDDTTRDPCEFVFTLHIRPLLTITITPPVLQALPEQMVTATVGVTGGTGRNLALDPNDYAFNLQRPLEVEWGTFQEGLLQLTFNVPENVELGDSYTFTLTVTSGEQMASNTCTVEILSCGNFGISTTETSYVAFVGQPFRLQVGHSGKHDDSTIEWSVDDDSDAELSLSIDADGLITSDGNIMAGEEAPYEVTVTAREVFTNMAGEKTFCPTATTSFMLNVSIDPCGDYRITVPAAEYCYTAPDTGSTPIRVQADASLVDMSSATWDGATAWAVADDQGGALGLSIDADGLITGTATLGKARHDAYRVTATGTATVNNMECVKTAVFDVFVVADLDVQFNDAGAAVTTVFTREDTTKTVNVGVTGGLSPVAMTLGGTAPEWASLTQGSNSDTNPQGERSGDLVLAPGDTVAGGDYTVPVVVTASGGCGGSGLSTTAALTVTVIDCGNFAISADQTNYTYPAGANISIPISVSNQVPNSTVRWSVDVEDDGSTELTGLSISSVGTVTGTMVDGELDPYTVTVSAVQVVSGVDCATATASFTLTPGDLCATFVLEAISDVCVERGNATVVQPIATGNLGTVTWSMAGAPTGLSINATTGRITGTTLDTVSGGTDITVTATDTGQTNPPCSKSQTFNLLIYMPVAITVEDDRTVLLGETENIGYSVNGGSGSYTVNVTGLPEYMSNVRDSQSSHIAVDGTDDAAVAETVTVTITANSSVCGTTLTGTETFDIEVVDCASFTVTADAGPHELRVPSIGTADITVQATANGAEGTVTWLASADTGIGVSVDDDGLVTVTADVSHVETSPHVITVSATDTRDDGITCTDTATFTVSVLPSECPDCHVLNTQTNMCEPMDATVTLDVMAPVSVTHGQQYTVMASVTGCFDGDATITGTGTFTAPASGEGCVAHVVNASVSGTGTRAKSGTTDTDQETVSVRLPCLPGRLPSSDDPCACACEDDDPCPDNAHTRDPSDCECRCPCDHASADNCPDCDTAGTGRLWNPLTCACECPAGRTWDAQAGRCVCSGSADDCPDGELWCEETCRCVTPSPVSAPPNEVWDEATCQWVCATSFTRDGNGNCVQVCGPNTAARISGTITATPNPVPAGGAFNITVDIDDDASCYDTIVIVGDGEQTAPIVGTETANAVVVFVTGTGTNAQAGTNARLDRIVRIPIVHTCAPSSRASVSLDVIAPVSASRGQQYTVQASATGCYDNASFTIDGQSGASRTFTAPDADSGVLEATHTVVVNVSGAGTNAQQGTSATDSTTVTVLFPCPDGKARVGGGDECVCEEELTCGSDYRNYFNRETCECDSCTGGQYWDYASGDFGECVDPPACAEGNVFNYQTLTCECPPGWTEETDGTCTEPGCPNEGEYWCQAREQCETAPNCGANQELNKVTCACECVDGYRFNSLGDCVVDCSGHVASPTNFDTQATDTRVIGDDSCRCSDDTITTYIQVTETTYTLNATATCPADTHVEEISRATMNRTDCPAGTAKCVPDCSGHVASPTNFDTSSTNTVIVSGDDSCYCPGDSTTYQERTDTTYTLNATATCPASTHTVQGSVQTVNRTACASNDPKCTSPCTPSNCPSSCRRTCPERQFWNQSICDCDDEDDPPPEPPPPPPPPPPCTPEDCPDGEHWEGQPTCACVADCVEQPCPQGWTWVGEPDCTCEPPEPPPPEPPPPSPCIPGNCPSSCRESCPSGQYFDFNTCGCEDEDEDEPPPPEPPPPEPPPPTDDCGDECGEGEDCVNGVCVEAPPPEPPPPEPPPPEPPPPEPPPPEPPPPEPPPPEPPPPEPPPPEPPPPEPPPPEPPPPEPPPPGDPCGGCPEGYFCNQNDMCEEE